MARGVSSAWLRFGGVRRAVASVCAVSLAAGLMTVVDAGRPVASRASTTNATAVTPVSSRPDRASAMVAAQAQGSRVLVDGETTESSQTWANPDGTYTEQDAAGPVRVPDGSGGWRQVDTTLHSVDGQLSAPGVVGAPVFSAGGTVIRCIVSGYLC